jgi:hypothetical protein
MQLGKGELRSVDGDQHVQLALFGGNVGNVHVENSRSIACEFLLCRLVALDIGQPTNCGAADNDEAKIVSYGMVRCSA